MSISQHRPGEAIDLRPLGDAITNTRTHTLFETDHVKSIRMVLQAEKVLADHKAPGDITVHCLEGKIEFTSLGHTATLEPGHLLYLTAGEVHSVKAIKDSSFLLTIASVK